MKDAYRSIAKIIIVTLIIAAILVGGGYYAYWHFLGEPAVTEAATDDEGDHMVQILQEELTDIAELNTADYMCTYVQEYTDSKQISGWNIPLTEKSFTISYDGTVKAGIQDLSLAKVSKRDDTTIVVQLPAVEITNKEIDKDSLKVYDESHNIFNQTSVEDVNQAQKDLEQEMEDRAKKYGLLDQAKTNAEKILTSLLKNVSDDYDIVIEWQ